MAAYPYKGHALAMFTLTFGLRYHDTKNKGAPRDIDIICPLSLAQSIAWYADKKIKHGIFVFDKPQTFAKSDKQQNINSKKRVKVLRTNRYDVEDEEYDSNTSISLSEEDPDLKGRVVDIHLYDDNLSAGFKKIFELANSDNWKTYVHTYKLILKKGECEIDCFVPDVSWLYSLLRGHIHRIPRVFNKQSSNISLWQKYVESYSFIREKFGYNQLDKMMKDDFCMTSIFEAEFADVCQKLGDAPALDGKEEDSFFDDNVKRYIDHDELHLRVAKINRGANATPLFPKFIIDPTKSVMMDESLFLAATLEEQIQTVKEEIMVLYLERKALPAVVEFGEQLKQLWEFDQIVCHFITNLCGNGQSWLRWWCLNHYKLLSDQNEYPEFKLKQFVNLFRKDGPVANDLKEADDSPEMPQTIETVSDLIKFRDILAENRISGNLLFDFGTIPPLKKDEHSFSWNKQNDDGEIYVYCHRILYDSCKDVTDIEFEEDNYDVSGFKDSLHENPDFWKFFNLYFGENRDVEEEVVIRSDYVLHNVTKGVAVSFDDLCCYVIEIKGATFCATRLHTNENQTTDLDTKLSSYSESTRTVTFYKSTCDGGYDKKRDLTYLEHFGKCFPDFEELFEVYGRMLTGIRNDDDEDDY